MGVLIVNSHAITRMSLAQMINHQLDLVVCDEAGTAAKALDALNASKPDLVLSEIALPDKSGLEVIKDSRRYVPDYLCSLFRRKTKRFMPGWTSEARL
jgi:DNA-binding NarL/FixJ family response regulator